MAFLLNLSRMGLYVLDGGILVVFGKGKRKPISDLSGAGKET